MKKDIEFVQAVSISQKISEERKQEIADTIEEIKTSCFDMYDARDIQALASKASMTCNEVRNMNTKHQKIHSLDLLHTFDDDETDDIIDYY